MAEALFVALVLATVAALTGGGLLQWLSAAAVLLSFMHAQVADRMSERQAAQAKPDVPCYRWALRYFMAKELAWCAVFTLSGAWPALAGVALFLAYPAWRRWWRRPRFRDFGKGTRVELHGAEALVPRLKVTAEIQCEVKISKLRLVIFRAAVAAAGGALRLVEWTGRNVAQGVQVRVVGALLVAMLATSAWADAPAAAPRKPRPSPSPIAEPFDLVPTDPPEPLPELRAAAPAPEPSPTPKPTSIEKANARPFRVTTAVGALATVTGDTGTDITPTFWIDADGPLAFGNDRSVGRLGARIGLSSSPGETINAADVNTYRAAQVSLRLGYVVGHLRDVETTVVLEGGFSSRLKGSADLEPRTRLVRDLGVGLRFDARKSNASMIVLAGFDEATASCAPSVVCTGFNSGLAFMAYGQVPIVQGAVLFTGDASLSVTAGASWYARRDVLRIGVVLDPVQAVKVLKGK